MSKIRRIYVEKKEGFDVAAEQLLADFKESLELDHLEGLRLLNRYDISDISEAAFQESCHTILAEGPVDNLYHEEFSLNKNETAFAVEYLPGQYDQRADSAEQCMQILNDDEKPAVRTAEVIVLRGDLTEADIKKIKEYYINPVDSREAALEKPESLEMEYKVPEEVRVITGFINKNEAELEELIGELGLAMSMADLLHTQNYFRDTEKRDPSITEIRVLDTYWSDHCRHTTFLSRIEDVEFEKSSFTEVVEKAYQEYLA